MDLRPSSEPLQATVATTGGGGTEKSVNTVGAYTTVRGDPNFSITQDIIVPQTINFDFGSAQEFQSFYLTFNLASVINSFNLTRMFQTYKLNYVKWLFQPMYVRVLRANVSATTISQPYQAVTLYGAAFTRDNSALTAQPTFRSVAPDSLQNYPGTKVKQYYSDLKVFESAFLAAYQQVPPTVNTNADHYWPFHPRDNGPFEFTTHNPMYIVNDSNTGEAYSNAPINIVNPGGVDSTVWRLGILEAHHSPGATGVPVRSIQFSGYAIANLTFSGIRWGTQRLTDITTTQQLYERITKGPQQYYFGQSQLEKQVQALGANSMETVVANKRYRGSPVHSDVSDIEDDEDILLPDKRSRSE